MNFSFDLAPSYSLIPLIQYISLLSNSNHNNYLCLNYYDISLKTCLYSKQVVRIRTAFKECVVCFNREIN